MQISTELEVGNRHIMVPVHRDNGYAGDSEAAILDHNNGHQWYPDIVNTIANEN